MISTCLVHCPWKKLLVILIYVSLLSGRRICGWSHLLIGSRNNCSAQDDISHIPTTATRKHLNTSKTWEMMVVSPRGPSKAVEPPIAGGKRSFTMKILGVTINERLAVLNH